jgi:hypothetical protein
LISELDIARRQPAHPKPLPDADLEAARPQDPMLDDEGRLVWVRIRRAIEALLAPPPSKPN